MWGVGDKPGVYHDSTVFKKTVFSLFPSLWRILQTMPRQITSHRSPSTDHFVIKQFIHSVWFLWEFPFNFVF